jgi:hypothetical protein
MRLLRPPGGATGCIVEMRLAISVPTAYVNNEVPEGDELFFTLPKSNKTAIITVRF